MDPIRPADYRALLRNRAASNGEAGAAWVRKLPQLLAAAVERWSLRLQPHFAKLSHNYVSPVLMADGQPAVLKVCFVGDAEGRHEFSAAVYFGGNGAARVLDSDPGIGALLLQRLEPGLPLSSLQDDEAEVTAAAVTMRRLWRPPRDGNTFPTMSDWFNTATAVAAVAADKFDWLAAGLSLGRQLAAASEPEPVVLHGDLHHWNLLSHGDDWVCIDAKGVAGERAWEAGPYLYNNLADGESEQQWRRTIRRRADQFAAELSLDRARIYACGAAYAALSSAWSLEEPRKPEKPLRSAWFAKHRAVMQELAGF